MNPAIGFPFLHRAQGFVVIPISTHNRSGLCWCLSQRGRQHVVCTAFVVSPVRAWFFETVEPAVGVTSKRLFPRDNRPLGLNSTFMLTASSCPKGKRTCVKNTVCKRGKSTKKISCAACAAFLSVGRSRAISSKCRGRDEIRCSDIPTKQLLCVLVACSQKNGYLLRFFFSNIG